MNKDKSEKRSANKLIIFIPVIIVLVLLISGGIIFLPKLINSDKKELSYDELTENMQSYDDLDLKIHIYVPEDYERTENQFNVYYHKNEESMIYLTHEASTNDLENLSLGVQASYTEQTDNFNLKKNSKVTVGITDLCVMEYDYEIVTSETTYKKSGMTVLCISNGEAYFLTCVTDQDKYEQYREDYVKTYNTILPFVANDSSQKQGKKK